MKICNKVKLIIGFISAYPELMEGLAAQLTKRFGSIDFESSLLKFDHTNYYEKELGKDLLRKFISFKRLISQEKIGRIKLYTRKIESRFRINENRRINIDPGYVNLGKLVLFSTKDYTHRIYLGEGIYAEVTLYFKEGSFKSWPWTYPDYKTAEYIDIFNKIRALYAIQLKETKRC